MERQDSVNSIGSVASALTIASSEVGGGIGQGDLSDQTQTVVVAVFGALSTLFSQRWEDSKRYATARFLLEHLQLLLIMLQAHWLWNIDYSHTFWDIADVVLVKNLFIPRGYVAYADVLYALVTIIGVTLAACGWISYTFIKNGPVQNRWFIKMLRLLMMLIYQVFYVAILDFLVSPLACNWFSSDPQIKGHHSDFPTYACKEMPHLGTMAVSTVFAALFAATSGLFALADVTPNPVSQGWLAQADSSVEFKAWIFKTVIVLCANLLEGTYRVQSVLVMIAAGWLAYTYLRWQPYYFGWVNHLRTGLYGMTAYLSLMLTINVWEAAAAVEDGQTLAAQHRHAEGITLLALALMPVAFAVSAAASYLRLALASRRALQVFRSINKSDAAAMMDLKHLFKFVDEYEVEIVSRCCRKWRDFEDKELDPRGADLAEVVIKAGLAQFSHSSHMILVWVNFLADVLKHKGSCGSQLLAAKKLNPNWCDRYLLFVRDQQQLSQQKGETTGSGGVDLTGYLDFQRSYKLVLRAHKAALRAQQSFWRVLMHTSITSDEIVHALVQLENSKAKADRGYRTVLERYPTNVKVLRAFGRFLDDLKHDPWSASKYLEDADKYEIQEAHAAHENALLAQDMAAGKSSAMMVQVDERNNAVCVINAHGIIQMANKKLLKMFGYSHGQLEGKNVSMLMPQPFSGRHDGYLRNYQTTGKAKILDTLREVVGLHQDHYVFPLHLMVTKISGTGPDAIFMGVLQPAVKDTECIKAWMTVEGTVLCVDGLFSDWLGKSPAECLGRPFTSLAVNPQTLQGLLDQAQVATEEEFQAGGLCTGNVQLEHKFASPLRVFITIELGGTASQRLLVAIIRKHAVREQEYLMVSDHKGRIMYATHKFATLLGFPDSKAVIKTDFAKYLAQPYRQLHGNWMKDVPAKVSLNSCRNKIPVTFVTQRNTVEPVLLDITAKEQGENNIYIVKVEPITYPQAMLHRRMSLTVDKFGTVLEAQDSPATLFGFSPQAVVGRNISNILDILVGLPEADGPDGRDMVSVLSAMVHRVVHDPGFSWRCGVHPPMTAEEVAMAKSNVMHANMLANQTKPAILELEFEEADDDFGGVESIIVHLWRADMMTGVVEVDRQGVIVKAGCCDLHMAGPLLGVDSECMLQTPLSQWVDVPEGYRGLMMDQKKRGGLRQHLEDIKVGPLRNASGNHADGDLVHVTVQAVVKEETSGAPRLVVKMSINKPRKGDPGFVKQLLQQAQELQQEEELVAAEGVSAQLVSAPKLVSAASFGAFRGAFRLSSRRLRGGLSFIGGDSADGSSSGGQQPSAGPATNGRASKLKPKKALKKAADAPDAHGEMANGSLSRAISSPPADAGMNGNAAADDASEQEEEGVEKASQQSGDGIGSVQADYARGKRLRRLARVMNSRLALKTASRFQKHTVLMICGLLLAHVVCLAVSLVTINSQAQYMKEVDDAGDGVIAMHKIAIECRALDAISGGVQHPDIFTKADVDLHMNKLQKATDDFQFGHQMTYFGSNKMRRLENRPRYKLRDFFEADMWNSTEMIDTVPPSYMTRTTGLWEIGNEVLNAARDIHFNYAAQSAAGHTMARSRFWYYVVANAPGSLYDGYKNVLYGLVDRAVAYINSIKSTMAILLVLEGCVLALATTLYMAFLTNKMEFMRANLFSMFLVVPNGFLRALATRKVRLDREAESDDESQAGDVQPEQEQQSPRKVDLSSLNTGKTPKGQERLTIAAKGGGSKRKGQPPGAIVGRFSGVFNPMAWIGSRNYKTIDTGKKQLVRSSHRTLLVTLPFLVWCAILIMIYGVSLMQMGKVETPFQMLNMVNFLVFRTFRVVLVALEMCLAGDASAIADLKHRTAECLQELRQDYTSFLYGFKALGPDAVRNDLSTNEAGIFQDSKLANIFFRDLGCMREDPSTCFPPSHKYYAATHNGLDAMASRFIEETELLLADQPGDINISNARFEYIWQVGQEDLSHGISSADHAFRALVENMFHVLITAHVLVFVFSLLGGLLVWLLVLRPYLRRTGKEIYQIAEMLSQLPMHMDVEALVKQALATGEDAAAAAASAAREPQPLPAADSGGLLEGGLGRLTAPPGKTGHGKKGYDASNKGSYNGGPLAGKYGGNYYRGPAAGADEDD